MPKRLPNETDQLDLEQTMDSVDTSEAGLQKTPLAQDVVSDFRRVCQRFREYGISADEKPKELRVRIHEVSYLDLWGKSLSPADLSSQADSELGETLKR